MKKIIPILSLSFCSLFLQAQFENNYLIKEKYKTYAGFNANIDLASSSISNQFMNTFLWKDNIESKEKNWMFNALDKSNTLGFDLEEKLSFITFPDTFAGTTNMGLFVSYGNYYHIDMNVTEDVLKLFFGGNSQFKGKTADIGNSSLNLLNYQQLLLGVVSKFGNGNLHHSFGVGIGINIGIEHTQIQFDHGSLYTDNEAEYIDITADYDIYRSDTSSKTFIKGYGSSLNLYYSFTTENNNHFEFSMTDLGFIRWNKNSQPFSKDTSIHYDGIFIDDPLNIEENILGNSSPDSIVNTFTYSDSTMVYYMQTPVRFRISYLQNLSDKFSIEGSVTKKLYVHCDPLFMLKVNYYCCSNNFISANINYGGYTGGDPLKSHNLNAGIEYSHLFGRGLILQAGTNFLNGFIYPNSQTAQGAYVSIRKYFF